MIQLPSDTTVGPAPDDSARRFSLASLPSILEGLHRVLSGRRRLSAASVYGGATVVALALAFLFRFELHWPTSYTRTFLLAAPLLVAIRLSCATIFRLSTGRWRFVGTGDVVRLAVATVVGTLLFFALTRVLPFAPPVPRSVVLLEWILTTYITAAVWIARRSLGGVSITLMSRSPTSDMCSVRGMGVADMASTSTLCFSSFNRSL